MSSKQRKVEPSYTKQQLLKSIRFAQYKDALESLLNDKQTYTIEQVNTLLNQFYGKEGEA